MSATKRIPVSKERWEQLGQMKKAGQTYDELLEELIEKAHREELAQRMDDTAEADREDLTSVDEL